MRHLIFSLLAGLLLILFCTQVPAQDLVTERAVFDDPGGSLTLEKVRKMPFSSAEKVIGKGYTRSTIWIRLTVDSGADDRSPVLRIFPPTLDDVMVFAPARTGAAPGGEVAGGLPLRGGTLVLDGQRGMRVYYLRIRASGSMLVLPSIETPEQFQKGVVTRAMILGAVLACCFPIIVATLVLIVLRHELLYIAFLVNFLVSVAVFFGWFGYLHEFFGPGSVIASAEMFSFLVLINIFTGVLFFRAVLGHFGLPQWGRWLFILFFALYIPVVLSLFLIDRQLALSLGTLWGIAANAFFLPLTAYLFYRKKSATWYIAPLIFLAILLLIRTFLIMRGTIAPDESIANMMAFRMFAFSSFFFIVLLLLDRDKNNRLRVSILKEAVAHSLADSEKQRRIIQERFMTMLMHELKTPLAIIQLATASLGRHLQPASADAVRISNINRSVDDLNALVERCVQADQFEQGGALIKKAFFSANALARELVDTIGSDRIVIVGRSEFRVYSDYQYVRLILQNLMSNALKYSQPDSTITLALQHTSANGVDGVIISVSNAVGPIGVPEPSRIFSRYYRAEAARGQVGAGLGLWLSQQVAGQLGSKVHSEVHGEQLVFSLGLAIA